MTSSPEDMEDFAALLAEYDSRSDDPEVGERIAGTIVSIGQEFAFVDINAKSEGAIARTELVDDDGNLEFAVGDEVEALISAIDASGNYVLRVKPGRGHTMLTELRSAWQQKVPVEGTVTAVVKGGIEVTIAGMKAFCPISQITDSFTEDASEFIGQRFEFRIQRFEESGRRTNLVVSRRVLLEEEKKQRATELRERLKVGAVLEGTVNSVTTYGAFVDLGGLDGLLHVSEMSHSRIEDPREHFLEGQIIDVQVMKIEAPRKAGETERISLSTRVFEQDPWHDAERRFRVGQRLDGLVKRLETFGAFVELTPGIEGLVHVSKMGGGEHVRHARDIVELGQAVRVEVEGLDLDSRKISLALIERQDTTSADVTEYRKAHPDDPGFGSLASFFDKSSDDSK